MMKRKMIFAALFAAAMLVSGICSAAGVIRCIDETAARRLWLEDAGRMSIYVPTGDARYIEYSAMPPADDAAREINMMLGLDPVEAYATNDGLLAYLGEYGDLAYLEPIILEGRLNSMVYERTVYHFTFHRYE